MSRALDLVLKYHQETKHRLNAFARGPGRLDWANQPYPFRRYVGSPLIMLDRKGAESAMAAASAAKSTPSQLNMQSISTLFFNSLALSAWKRSGSSTWSLRVNPSSGNLHPTEGYLITGSIEGLEGSPGVFHYDPAEHALELRGRLPAKSWSALRLPAGTLLIALSSIHWRESWKYGERAFRYSMIDVGHALAALGVAASCLRWQAALADNVGTEDLARMLGLGIGTVSEGMGPAEGETERPNCLLAVFTDGEMHDAVLPREFSSLVPPAFQGAPNILSVDHVDWPIIENVAGATAKPLTKEIYEKIPSRGELPMRDFCRFIRKRRSAQAMDRRTAMPFHAFCEMLGYALPLPGNAPFNSLPWKPRVHLALFVHRVEGLSRGLYMLLRDGGQRECLKAAMSADFAWERPTGTPEGLDLYLLQQGDARYAARQSSCQQDIASDGCFAAAMIAEFERPLQDLGPWFYPRLHWECGMIGQALYLGAEAMGFRGCGMGCYFDDVVHEMLGLKSMAYQDLYHFAAGKALEDPRLTTLPAYG
ncbi:MAG: SagB/ThcOx family dehydrogenase [Methanotrichaceae archaeon]|nr:SagB/ThcOx family dehydrogenase [Methanotrichaceae archaeon]